MTLSLFVNDVSVSVNHDIGKDGMLVLSTGDFPPWNSNANAIYIRVLPNTDFNRLPLELSLIEAHIRRKGWSSASDRILSLPYVPYESENNITGKDHNSFSPLKVFVNSIKWFTELVVVDLQYPTIFVDYWTALGDSRYARHVKNRSFATCFLESMLYTLREENRIVLVNGYGRMSQKVKALLTELRDRGFDATQFEFIPPTDGVLSDPLPPGISKSDREDTIILLMDVCYDAKSVFTAVGLMKEQMDLSDETHLPLTNVFITNAFFDLKECVESRADIGIIAHQVIGQIK